MPQDPRNALSALLRAADIQDHEQILQAVNAAIKADKDDVAAQHTKVVALLKLDRFDDALRVISGAGIKLQATCVLEQAYALYKTGKLDEASDLIESAGLDRRGLRHVAAQVAYRAEKSHEAEAIYRNMLDTDAAGEESDLRINISAATTQSQWEGTPSATPVMSPDTLDTFEMCFNVACGELARGNTSRAASLLQRAAMLCDNSDELTDEEKKTELRSIRAQQAYLFAKIGKPSSALEVYEMLGPPTANDGRDFAVITQNNHFSLEPPGNPFLRQRKAESLMASAAQSDLFSYQSNILKRNNLIIDLGAFKTQGVTSRTEKTLSQARLPSTSPQITAASIINAAAHTQGLDEKEALRKLQTLAAKRTNDVGLVLTIVQLQIQQQQAGAALTTLTTFLNRLESSEEPNDTDVRFSPGLVALAVSLFRSQQREASAKAEIVKAAQYWQNRPSHAVGSLLLEAGIELMRSSNADDLLLAGSAFEKLLREQQATDVASAGLVAAYAASDASKVRQNADQLPPVGELIGGIDVDELFAAGVAVSKSSAVSKKRPATEEANADKATKRRRRKLPKNYVEGKTPDPERWLPLRDRSSYRPKGKKGKKRAGEATQGGIVKEEETLGLVGGGGVKVEKASAPGSNNKKKKKGKK
ncbi:signal recognition particle subunit [Trichoderma citrinoviride]|uniref:Signal recognition particle subunit SRP72 n=1 Tax=Trichoderma citrinoviride TaxID=58853 RepID=A0A2T4B2Y4_9HYPO|nr:signal recognition particle subunit [Trichoderma citrinoviride]PTB63561.1 signal recognition particle subunit [Trichoderma citrinoviride]